MTVEPYRKLFALGLVSGIIGVGLWPLYLTGHVTYPILPHSQIMVTGMFLAFVSGFLMTALPKMSGTAPASVMESWVAVGLLVGSVFMALVGQNVLASALAGGQFIFLIQFAVRRFLKRQANPPQGFLFVPFGLLWGLLAMSLQTLEGAGFLLPAPFSELGKIGIQQAFLLNLVVGLGSRLIPFLSRVGVADPMRQLTESKAKGLSILVALNLSFLLEPVLPTWSVYCLRGVVLGVAAVVLFGIFKKPSQVTIVGVSLRASVLMMTAAYLGIGFFPQFQLALLHIVFIGGYTLLTLTIATRVTLAHGGHSLIPEVRSPALVATLMLLTVAAALRMLSILPWASAFWLLAVLTWSIGIGRFLFARVRSPV